MKSCFFYILIAITLVFTGCSGGGSDGATNEVPVARAGIDQNVIVGDTVTFDGSSSSDDGSIEAYAWDENGTELSTDMSFTKSDFAVGPHTITLTVTDNQGAISSDDVLITVNTPGNLAPVADAQDVTTDENVALDITLSATDGDSDSLEYTVVTLPANGAISGTLPNLTYTPTDYYYGSDSFSFRVNDGIVDSAIVTVDITINDNPDTILHNNVVYGTITGTQVWLDRNLGASRACVSSDDEECFGDYYQWGRGTDGHEKENSSTTDTQSSTITPNHGNFIKSTDWTTADSDGLIRSENWNPCPSGYRIPTVAEIQAESIHDDIEAYSKLKLPTSGFRNNNNASIAFSGSNGYLWLSDVNGFNSYIFLFQTVNALAFYDIRSYGISVRCIKD